MKMIVVLFLFISSLGFGQVDFSPVVVNAHDNAKLQWSGQPVKQKVVILDVSFIHNGQKDFHFNVVLERYENVGGTYGAKIIDLIAADTSISDEEKTDLLTIYEDKHIQYSTAGRFVNAAGDIVPVGTPGAILELQYWQSFKMNHASLNMTSASTQGALDAVYKIIVAIVKKIDQRKNI